MTVMKGKKTRAFSAIVAVVVLVAMMPVWCFTAKASTVTGTVPITCYTLSTGRTPTYHYSNGRYVYTGYIDATDQCYIQQLLSNGYVRVKYPVGRGRYRTEYARTNAFFVNEYFSPTQVKAGRNLTTYRKGNLSQRFGSIYSSDSVIVIGTSGNSTQMLYPVSGGYKLGFVSGVFSQSSVNNGDLNSTVYPEDGYYKIKSAINQNYVLDVYDNAQYDNANIELWENNGGDNQTFYLQRQNNGSYVITAKHSGKALDVENGGSRDGTNIIQWTRHNASNQCWVIEKTTDGYYAFRSLCNGKYLDANNAEANNGTNIQCWTGNTSGAQKFVLEKCINGGASITSSKAQELVSYELSQLGVADYRGNNNVIYNNWYYGRTISGTGYAWCMVFQAYCAEKVGLLDTAVPKTNNCSDAVNWYKNRGLFRYRSQYTPKAGDLVFYGYGGGSHVGLVIGSPLNGYLQVVEGNVYDSSNGNYSVQKYTRNYKRRTDSSYVYGYGVLNY